jgi:N-acetylglucosaminyl-diphospho-decaprenol L-rhamnosyltransferase
MTTSTPDLSIIIVNWNVRDLLAACLRSLEYERDRLVLQVIVVDSHSADDSVAMVRRDFPWVELIVCEENIGFPRGNNLGLQRANGRYVLLLNPDTEVVGAALSTMMAHMEAHPTVGALGPQLLNPDGTVQSSRRRFPTLATALFESTWLEPFAPASILRHYYMQDVADGETAEVDWVTGACLLVRRDVVEEIGGLDEDYFMYSEELDWCRRIKAAGWQIVYLPMAQVIHYVGKSSEQAVTARHINFQRAKLRYFYKYHGPVTAWLLRLFVLWNYSWQLLVEAFKGIVGHKRPLRWQRVRAYWQVIRSGLRPAGY